MPRKGVVKIILFIIIALLVFQVIPTSFSPMGEFQSHQEDHPSAVITAVGLLHSDILYISRENQKFSLQKFQIKNFIHFVPQFFVEDISSVNFFFKEVPTDFRTEIRKTIPNYFNGSKYKDEYFAI